MTRGSVFAERLNLLKPPISAMATWLAELSQLALPRERLEILYNHKQTNKKPFLESLTAGH
jgi:hypothetical protein